MNEALAVKEEAIDGSEVNKKFGIVRTGADEKTLNRARRQLAIADDSCDYNRQGTVAALNHVASALRGMAGIETIQPIISVCDQLLNLSLEKKAGTTPADFLLALKLLDNWKIAVAWMSRRKTQAWTINEYPFYLTHFKRFEKHGDCVLAKLELCEACFEALDRLKLSGTLDYKGFEEIFLLSIEEDILFNCNNPPASIFLGLKQIRSVNKALKEVRNPYNDEPHWKHNYNLFNVVLAIAERQRSDSNSIKQIRSRFRKTFDNFKSACKAWSCEIDRNQEFYGGAYVEPDGQTASGNKKRIEGRRAKEKICKLPKDFRDLFEEANRAIQ